MKIVIGYTGYPSLFQSLCQEFNERKTYILLSKMSKVTKEGLQKKFKKNKKFLLHFCESYAIIGSALRNAGVVQW